MSLERIGPYQLMRIIGSGGMGTVYLARHDDSDEQVALKALSPEMAQDEGFRERFRREIAALESLRNKHVVQLFDSGSDGNRFYYTMEYVDGETLTDRLTREKRLHWKETINISIQICVALKAAHDAGIIHRDLKPSNLMLANDGLVKLADFGVAKLFAAQELTLPETIIGTAEFMSPEQAAGQRVTKRSDLYSLGAVMYAMLTGRPPFTGKSAIAIIRMHQTHQFDMPNRYVDLPYWLENIVCQLLEKDPNKRFPDAYVVNRQLESVFKRVELSQSDSTAVAQLRDAEPGETLARDPSDPAYKDTKVKDGGRIVQGPGEATLVRDLVRMEVQRAHEPTAVGKVFNNTWVLIACLSLLVIVGIYAAGRPVSDDDDSGGDAVTWQSEVRRTIERAEHLRTIGETETAIRELDAVRELLPEDGSAVLTGRLRKSSADLQASLLGKRDLIQSKLDEAQSLSDGDDLPAARLVWERIVLRYNSEPDVAALVNEARKHLESHRKHE
ncbi:MAG: serine/threonine-protein kinase [Planctomycetota bacterium]|nr:serine/threonine-protein kinase [Planctomycetota bacterium]